MDPFTQAIITAFGGKVGGWLFDILASAFRDYNKENLLIQLQNSNTEADKARAQRSLITELKNNPGFQQAVREAVKAAVQEDPRIARLLSPGIADYEEYEDEVEVTRDELINALQEVLQNLSGGLRGPNRGTYRVASDLAQNEWFYAGVSDRKRQYAITMWPAEGDEDMLRIDIGSEEDVHRLAADPEMLAAMTDDFIEAMDEDYDEYEEYDEEDELEEEYDEEDELYDEEYYEDEDELGNLTPR
ncbi:MAG TPA: hypothetical protein VF826_02080 [Chloroflexia bacterium]|jgi:hypothetical protein